jgi:putative membrane-bound dehydrogenase-like protein
MAGRSQCAAGSLVSLVACLAAIPPNASGQVEPERSARQMKPAEGLEVSLWAAEPMVVNPTTIDVDSRGRVWVTEGLNYRLTRSGNREFGRIEEADRIKILADTDGDGKADKMTVFADRIFPVPMGIAVEEHYDPAGNYKGCKVYVGNSPSILVLEDSDGDDRADKRYPLLTGFGGVDSDHGVHGMVFGPDGKLYFTHGDGCCSVQPDRSEKPQNFDVTDASGRRVSSDQLGNTLRVNRDGTQFEVIADRQRNNYETSPNSFGNLFTSDNDDDGNRGCRVIWMMDGGHYGYRTPGSPRHWGEEVPGNVPKLVGTGNGSPCGIMVYEGDLLPKEYSGSVLEVDAGTRQVNFFPITRKGAAFRTEYKVFLTSDDPWFRPVDATAAPDGSVFVADWYDAGVGGHAFKDQTTGRIYRVTPKGADPKAPEYDFGSVAGLIEALKSPNIAARDAAFRGLIARGAKASPEVGDLAVHGTNPVHRARALWVWHAIEGEAIALIALTQLLDGGDPRIREQAVRMLGRDCRENGHVEYTRPDAKQPPAALSALDVLLSVVHDPDAGVRRELILALRNLPTDQVGQALKTLAARWDGQDRWYLEALGLALRGREPTFLAELFSGSLYGGLNIEEDGQVSGVALPPYFPVDRNEAYISTTDPDLPANALTKTIGLMWEVHCAEVLPLLTRILPSLRAPELQQAADDVLMQIADPAGAAALADLFLSSRDEPTRRRQILSTLGRRLDGAWSAARQDPRVIEAVTAGLNEDATRAEAIATAASTGDHRYVPALMATLDDTGLPIETRVAAVEALSRIRPPRARAVVERLVQRAIEQRGSDPVSEAAVRALPRVADAGEVQRLVPDEDVPLGLRREAMRTLIATARGMAILDLVEKDRLPADLKSEATIALNSIPDRTVRERAAKLLPLPKSASGKPLPPFYDLVRGEGDPSRGREVFFRKAQDLQGSAAQACGECHRVQGQGQWIGPDLSTIGTKYGKDELLRSILTPSSAIGYNFRALTVVTSDGRVLTGLPIEELPDRIVLKTATGDRITIPNADIDAKRFSEVSLMPEGLAEGLGERDLVDLLEFLATLKQPVSIVGQCQAVGPLRERDGGSRPDLASNRPVIDADGRPHPWRRATANAEGLIDLGSGGGNEGVVYLTTPVTSATEQSARLVIDTKAEGLRVWLRDEEVELSGTDGALNRSASVKLPRGTSDLLIRIPAGSPLVTTLVSDRPLEFSGGKP